jgi:hypothetical protein
MMRLRNQKRLGLVLAGLLAGSLATMAPLAVHAQAAPARVLPDVTLVDQNGVVATTPTLQQSGKWLLLVLDPSLPATEKLLKALAARQPVASWNERLVLVVPGDAAAAGRMVARHTKLSGVVWMADRDLRLRDALALKVTPAIYAINERNEVAWQLLGIPQPARIEAMLRQWVQVPASATGR